MPNKNPFLDIKKRLYLASLVSTLGNIIILLIFVYCLVFRSNDIQISMLMQKLCVMGGLGFFSILIAIVPFANNLSRQCDKMKQLALIIADGDLTRAIPVEQRDEIGIVGQSLNILIRRINSQDIVGQICYNNKHGNNRCQKT
jgi:methyl-accepting chemotaxis protein